MMTKSKISNYDEIYSIGRYLQSYKIKCIKYNHSYDFSVSSQSYLSLSSDSSELIIMNRKPI